MIIKVPRVSFVLGDSRDDPTVRPLYGPARPDGTRDLAGWIRFDTTDVATRLMAMLDFADAEMPDDAESL